MTNLFGIFPSSESTNSLSSSVVITGEGKAFSAGGDLQYITDRANDTPHNNEAMMRQVFPSQTQIKKISFINDS